MFFCCTDFSDAVATVGTEFDTRMSVTRGERWPKLFTLLQEENKLLFMEKIPLGLIRRRKKLLIEMIS